MAFSIGELSATVTADDGKFMSSMNKVRSAGARAAEQVQHSFLKTGRKMQSIGSTLTRSLTLPMAAFGGATVKAFADFDSAMTQSTAIMDGVTDDVRKEMEGAARSVSQQLTTTSTEAAESYFFLASAGLDAQQSIKALPQVAKFAQAGMFDMARATDLATDAQSALGLTVDDAAQNMRNLTRVTDVLVKANTLANASVEQFSEALTNRAAAAFRAVNKDVEEATAVLAAFADQNMKGQRAGEQLARIMRILSQEASKNQKLFTDLGIIDTSGNLNNMADIIEILTNEMEGLSDIQKSAKLNQLGFTAEVQAAIKPLLGTADAIREYEEGLRNAQGITDEVANNQLKSLTAQFEILRNTVVNAGQVIGASITETFDIKGLVKDLQVSIKTGIDWFNSLSQETRKMAFTMAGVLGASGPIIAALGTLSVAIGAISAPIAGTAAAVGAAATLIISNWSEVESFFTTGGGAQMWDSVQQAADGMWSSLKALFEAGTLVLNNVWRDWGKQFSQVATSTVSAVLKITGSLFKSMAWLLHTFSGNWNKAWFSLVDAAAGILSTLHPALAATLNAQTAMMRAKLAEQEGMINDFGDKVDNILSGGSTDSLSGMADLFDFINTDLSNIQTTTSNLNIKKPFVEAKKPMHEVIKAADMVKQGFQEMTADEILNWSPDKPPMEKLFPPGSIGFVKEEMSELRSEMQAMVVGSEAFNIAKDKLAGMKSELISLRSHMVTSEEILQGFAETIGNAFSKAALHSKSLLDNLLSIGKQLASKAIITGLKFLLPGGPAVGGASFLGTLFGGSFHTGGIVSGGGEKMINAKGGEGVFTKGQMKAMGGLIRGGGNSMNERKMSHAFEMALGKHLQKLGPEEIYSMSRKGQFTY